MKEAHNPQYNGEVGESRVQKSIEPQKPKDLNLEFLELSFPVQDEVLIDTRNELLSMTKRMQDLATSGDPDDARVVPVLKNALTPLVHKYASLLEGSSLDDRAQFHASLESTMFVIETFLDDCIDMKGDSEAIEDRIGAFIQRDLATYD